MSAPFIYSDEADSTFNLSEVLLNRMKVSVNSFAYYVPQTDLVETCFLWDPTYFYHFDMFTELCGKVATAILLSDKYIAIILNSVHQLHGAVHDKICYEAGAARIKKLVLSKFFITCNAYNTKVDAASYILRDKMRIVFFADKMVSRLHSSKNFQGAFLCILVNNILFSFYVLRCSLRPHRGCRASLYWTARARVQQLAAHYDATGQVLHGHLLHCRSRPIPRQHVPVFI